MGDGWCGRRHDRLAYHASGRDQDQVDDGVAVAVPWNSRRGARRAGARRHHRSVHRRAGAGTMAGAVHCGILRNARDSQAKTAAAQVRAGAIRERIPNAYG
eukprot:ctg_667.g213